MIEELLNNNTVEINVQAENWEEAVRYGGSLLKKDGKIEARYIDAMLETVEELGPYIVIEKGIAIPHALPSKGSRDIGLSLITLKTPICFGNEENDPVKAVISFCAKDNISHMDMLSELMDLFEDINFLRLIYTANIKDEIIEYIRNKDF